MVDIVSAEARRKELLDESLGCVYPEDAAGIKQRYKDTSLVLFKEQLRNQQADNRSYLSFGTRRSSTVSEYGNTPIIFRKSRSANGELSKVGEQWPSLRGRSSLSNYTLHESKEFENERGDGNSEESDTEEDEYGKSHKNEREVTTRTTESEGKRRVVVVDGQTVNGGGKSVVCPTAEQEDTTVQVDNDGTVAENRKSFSHYDIQLQRHKPFIDEEPRGDEGEGVVDGEEEDDDDKDAVSMRTVLEVEGVDHKILLVRSPTSTKDLPEAEGQSGNRVESAAGNHESTVTGIPSQEQSTKGKPSQFPLESHVVKNAGGVSDAPEVDHIAVLRNYVQNSSPVNSVSNDRPTPNVEQKSCNPQSSTDWSKVDLVIIEPSDLHVPDIVNAQSIPPATNGNRSLTSRLLSSSTADDDDDDVVFIDAVSQATGQPENSLEKEPIASKYVTENPDVVPTTPKRRAKKSSELLSPIVSGTSPAPEVHVGNEDSVDELDKSLDSDSNHNGLLALPMRSPTPPKRSPRRSPRIPKAKEKSHERHASLDLPSNLDRQPSTSKAVTSPSPVIKSRDASRMFHFSLKKERSKSVSSLSTKMSKEKEKEKVKRADSEDPGFTNPVLTANLDEVKCDSSAKRVGVRSMVIDGTIKQNFIVIHPSDDSETIGLAPLSSFANGSRSSQKASKALSSVRSHISGGSSKTKIESVKRISSKQELREELLNTAKDPRDRECLNASMSSEQSKSKSSSNRENETHVHGSLASLTSSTVSHITSKVVVGAMDLSQIDCDSFNAPSPDIPLSSSRTTTSRLCIIM